jgi:hypothetical protein
MENVFVFELFHFAGTEKPEKSDKLDEVEPAPEHTPAFMFSTFRLLLLRFIPVLLFKHEDGDSTSL